MSCDSITSMNGYSVLNVGIGIRRSDRSVALVVHRDETSVYLISSKWWTPSAAFLELATRAVPLSLNELWLLVRAPAVAPTKSLYATQTRTTMRSISAVDVLEISTTRSLHSTIWGRCSCLYPWAEILTCETTPCKSNLSLWSIILKCNNRVLVCLYVFSLQA